MHKPTNNFQGKFRFHVISVALTPNRSVALAGILPLSRDAGNTCVTSAIILTNTVDHPVLSMEAAFAKSVLMTLRNLSTPTMPNVVA